MEEGGGEDDEEEADGEDLVAGKWSVRGIRMEEAEGDKRSVEWGVKHTKDRAMIVLRPAAILSNCRVHWLGP